MVPDQARSSRWRMHVSRSDNAVSHGQTRQKSAWSQRFPLSRWGATRLESVKTVSAILDLRDLQDTFRPAGTVQEVNDNLTISPPETVFDRCGISRSIWSALVGPPEYTEGIGGGMTDDEDGEIGIKTSYASLLFPTTDGDEYPNEDGGTTGTRMGSQTHLGANSAIGTARHLPRI
ncbi:hypothetical protein VTN00DRAFT_4797 [Thermoascus crustaceus]|uniref:uncharacterized protein n=1 Tax=Thermoascus crustaceus TaxID=5088 RepID=UPI003742B89F